ncbi:MAG: LacI family DNA-binding transcriptional regulator [Opitutaceae bacterium]
MIKLVDIANQLNLSRVTVSAVLNDRYKSLGISQATADKVIKTAKEMGYRRNEMAMSMKTGKSFLLGCMSGAINIGWGGRILEGSLNGIKDSPYSLKLESVHNSEDEINALQGFIGSRVAGVIACNINPKIEHITQIQQELKRYSIPMVCNNCRSDLSPYCVEAEHAGGSILAVKHLADLGHKDIAFIGGDAYSLASTQRTEGFIKGLGICGLSLGPNYLIQANWDYAITEESVKTLLNAKKRPTAIICANDEMAVVAIRTIQRAGLNVPTDISIIGFSDGRLSELYNPSVTCISQPEFDIGKASAKLLMDLIENPPEDPKTEVNQQLESTLIVRESTGPVTK